ncbi:TPA: hypothetical protein ACYQPB_003288 [Escherichia coli]
MSETELLKIIRRVTGASQTTGKQEATQPDSVIAENYARVVAEVMRRDCIDSLEVRKKPGGHWIIRYLAGLDLVGLASL